MNDTTFHGNGKIAYVPVVVNAKLQKPTNYDRLRAMSVEELAEFMNCGACPPEKDVSELCHDEDGGSVPDMCNLCWFNWLKQEASE